MVKPLIGINADFRTQCKDAYTQSFSFLHAGYADSVIHAGGIPIILPPLEDREDLAIVLNMVNGIVLTGGADLDCRNDGYMLHPSMKILDERRETFDRMLVEEVIERRMPVLAIGCGMQLLNVAMGGTLHLHIPEDLPRALPHRDCMDWSHRHALELEAGSLMERVYGDGEIRVNSLHHMAIDDIADGLEVTARCPDGVVEAFESKVDGWFVFGTQFHPENESASALDLRIFEELIAGVTGDVVELRIAA